MELPDRLETERVATAALGVTPFLAGVTKFTHPGFWTGYEPQLVSNIFQAVGVDSLLFFGLLETVLGLWLFSGRRKLLAASVTAAWLAAITVRVAMLGLWDLAIRDLGLALFAATVALFLYRS